MPSSYCKTTRRDVLRSLISMGVMLIGYLEYVAAEILVLRQFGEVIVDVAGVDLNV